MNFDDKLKFFQPKSDKNNTEIIKKKLESFNKAQEKKIKEQEEKKEFEKKQKEAEEQKRKEEQKEKIKELQMKQEEERKLKEEEKKKEEEEEKQRQEQKEKIRQEYLKKMEEEEKEKKRKEEEEKKKLEEEEQRKKEIQIQNFKDFQDKLEKQKKEEIEKKLLEQEKELAQILKIENLARNPINQREENKEKKEEVENENKEEKEIQNHQLYQTLENMCKLGNIIKNKIIQEKEQNTGKEELFISTKEAINQPENINSTDADPNQIQILGLLAQNLEENGITTAIEKNHNNSDGISTTTLQFLVNGLIEKPKYMFSFEFGEERNNELLNNEQEQKIFNNKLRKKLSLEYNIPEDKIIITCPEKGSYKVTVIFMSDEFNNNFTEENFKNSCTQEEFKELTNLKNVQKGVIMDGVKLNLSMLDSRGNQHPNGYGGGKRGGEVYIPPMGWIGYGLRVKDMYDNGNNDWLEMDNNPNEWAVAYHGIGKAHNTSDTEKITNSIIKGGDFKNGAFLVGNGQGCKDFDDVRHPGQKVGKGVYCTPDINVAEGYAGQSSFVNGKRYKMVFMMRVKPDKIRTSKESPKEWILDGTTNEMRPYRILLKKVLN